MARYRSINIALLLTLGLLLSLGTGFAAQVGSETAATATPDSESVKATITVDLEGFEELNAALEDSGIVFGHEMESQNNGFTMFGSIHVPPEQVYDDSIVIMGGTGKIEGHVNGDLVVLGGVVDVSGQIDGDLVLMGGALNLMSTAHIEGSLVTIGGVVNREDGAYIDEDSVTIGGTDSGAHSIKMAPDLSAFTRKINIFILLTWLILALVTTLIFMRPLESTVNATYSRPFQSLLAGFLFHVATLMILLALTILVIGIPLAGLGLIIWTCVAIFGTVSGFVLLGKIVMVKLGKGQSSILLLMLLGLVILSALRFLPFFLGVTIWHLWAMMGIGGTVISRFGSNKPWFAPRPTLDQYAAASNATVAVPPVQAPVSTATSATVQSQTLSETLPAETVIPPRSEDISS